ncbi:MAG TPA: SDR family oxidoreductase [Pyrinomonadaceae bacterium]|nr:SDR family oxidoreductase [Pyrinomonadaceae bacterium]
MSSENVQDAPEGIAVIGLSGRFPGAADADAFWRNLRDGVESIAFFTDEELLAAGVDASALTDPEYVRADGALDDIDLFDAAFFGFNPREAESLDPQQRFFLECSWEALEQAGYDPESYPGLIGVYAGAGTSTYRNNLYSNSDFVNLVGAFQIALGNNKDHLTTQVSYKLNLKGPSVAVQTACSTSLVAVGLACQNLLNYECDMALAGGVSIGVPQRAGYYFEAGGIGSPDGHCRAFDAEAQGTVGGSGVGVVVLKRLADALSDGDHIHAVIKGAAINNDGSLKVGYTAPSVDGQAKVIAMAHALAGINPETIGYVEAHGTGTPLGDPIEIAALSQAFGAGTNRKGFCAVGSVKTNIGHLDAAAGVAGLIKTILALNHKMLPPSLHFTRPNPNIDFDNSPFYVNTSLREWPENTSSPRRAGVSSFGIGGTNAHVVIEEAPPVDAVAEVSSKDEHLLIISARSETALETATANLAAHLKERPQLNLADVAYTLQTGRRAFTHRRALRCRDLEDAAQALASLDESRVLTEAGAGGTRRPVAFMFSGQGEQHVFMGLSAYHDEPVFRQAIDLCSEILAPHLGFDLRSLLYPKDEQKEEAELQLRQTAVAQPALFAIEYALSKWWLEMGVRPDAMIGHSLGEYVAACLAGVFSLEDALKLVAARGRLMQELPAGAMLAVPLSEASLRPFLNGQLSLAAVNGPQLCVLSGAAEAVSRLEIQLGERGLEGRRLRTSHAFHSGMMEPILERFTDEFKGVELKAPQIPYISNVTGTWITAEEATDPAYWAAHLRGTVRFAEGLEKLLTEPNRLMLEVGPGQMLVGLSRQHSKRTPEHLLLSSFKRSQSNQRGEDSLLHALARLWLAGVAVSWNNLYAHEKRRRVPLPTYPFERQRYWVERQEEKEATASSLASQQQHKKRDVADWFYLPSWKRGVPVELLRPDAQATAHKLRWLVFIDECGLGHNLASLLTAGGHEVFTVKAGEGFINHGAQGYTIAPGQIADYRTLMDELRSTGKLPDRILHLWSVTQDDGAQTSIEEFERAQTAGFYSLIFLAQALGEQQQGAGKLPVAVVSNRAQNVSGEDSLCPAKTTILGACKVIPQEYPHIICRSIDVIAPAPGSNPEERLIEQLLTEFMAETPETEIAYRLDQRWVRSFEPVRLEAAASNQRRLREGGVYLITGGLGGVGLILAGYLARAVKARLVLVGRTSLPPREDWAHWLSSHMDEDSVSRKITGVQELEAEGAEVLTLSADVSDREQMKEVIARTLERFGELNGVIHGAGLTTADAFQPIQDASRPACERHFQPKAYGAIVLDEVLSGVEPDFCLLLSSLSSVLGGLGFVAYAAANIFMDAYAESHSRGARPAWTSVNWDGWQLWEDDEEGADPAELIILPEEGAEAFERILSRGPVSRIVVSTGDLEAGINRWVRLESLRGGEDALSTDASDTTAPTHARPSLSNTYLAPRNEVERVVAETWQQLLGIERVGVLDDFFELGGHSLLAIQVVARLREAFQVEVPVRDIFDASTVSALAEKIDGKRHAAEREIEQMDEMLKLIEGLQDTDVAKLLARPEEAKAAEE